MHWTRAYVSRHRVAQAGRYVTGLERVKEGVAGSQSIPLQDRMPPFLRLGMRGPLQGAERRRQTR